MFSFFSAIAPNNVSDSLSTDSDIFRKTPQNTRRRLQKLSFSTDPILSPSSSKQHYIFLVARKKTMRHIGNLGFDCRFNAQGELRRLVAIAPAYAGIFGTRISFLFTNSSRPRFDSSLPYPDLLIPPNGRSGQLTSG